MNTFLFHLSLQRTVCRVCKRCYLLLQLTLQSWVLPDGIKSTKRQLSASAFPRSCFTSRLPAAAVNSAIPVRENAGVGVLRKKGGGGKKKKRRDQVTSSRVTRFTCQVGNHLPAAIVVSVLEAHARVMKAEWCYKSLNLNKNTQTDKKKEKMPRR